MCCKILTFYFAYFITLCNSEEIKTCPKGWYYFHASNKCFYVENKSYNWYDAKKECEKLDSNLATINSEDENLFVANLEKAIITPVDAYHVAWFGLHYDKNRELRYINTTDVPFAGQIMDVYFEAKGDCYIIYVNPMKDWPNNIFWMATICESKVYKDGFICSKDLGVPRISAKKEENIIKPKLAKEIKSCPNGWHYFRASNKCFYVKNKSYTWNEAKKECEKLDSNLATINSNDENLFVARLAKDTLTPVNAYHIAWFGLHFENDFHEPRYINTTDVPFLGRTIPLSFEARGDCYVIFVDPYKKWPDSIGWLPVPCYSNVNKDGFLCSIDLGPAENINMDEKPSSFVGYIILVLVVILILGCIICIVCKFRRPSKPIPNVFPLDELLLSSKLAPKTPVMSNLRLIKINELIIDASKKLGEGEFGAVYAAKLIAPKDKKIPVAVKVINTKKASNKNIERDMLDEAAIMAQLEHEHLLKLIGICLAEDIKIVTPFRPLGSLDKFLKVKKEFIGPRELLLYCYQISCAMEYLSRNKIVHRDLATRNVLMKTNHHIEVSDFGLSAIFADEIMNIGKIPYRWVPIECLIDTNPNLYGEATDVWSFGVTCWEILTFAKMPYENLKATSKNPLKSMYDFLSEGNRLETPSNCGLELHKTLLSCWTANPYSRPTFRELKTIFEKYHKNPYEYVIGDQARKEFVLSSPEDEQEKLIEEMLGKDDYLYTDFLEQESYTKGVELKVIENDDYFGMPKSLRDYYIDEKYYKRRSSDSNIYVTSRHYSTPKTSINKLLENNIYRSNSYAEIYQE